MENIVSVTVYKKFADLTGEQKNKKGDLFDPKGVRSSSSTYKDDIKNGNYTFSV